MKINSQYQKFEKQMQDRNRSKLFRQWLITGIVVGLAVLLSFVTAKEEQIEPVQEKASVMFENSKSSKSDELYQEAYLLEGAGENIVLILNTHGVNGGIIETRLNFELDPGLYFLVRGELYQVNPEGNFYFPLGVDDPNIFSVSIEKNEGEDYINVDKVKKTIETNNQQSPTPVPLHGMRLLNLEDMRAREWKIYVTVDEIYAEAEDSIEVIILMAHEKEYIAQWTRIEVLRGLPDLEPGVYLLWDYYLYKVDPNGEYTFDILIQDPLLYFVDRPLWGTIQVSPVLE